MMPYERVTAWQAAHELVLAVYHATETFPKTETVSAPACRLLGRRKHR